MRATDIIGRLQYPIVEPGVRQISAHPLGALGQHLEGVLWTQHHDRQDLIDEEVRHAIMKEVRHRVDENPPRAPPA